MVHRLDWKDVKASFANYQGITGDHDATLERAGACWRLTSKVFDTTIESYGAGMMVSLIRAFCDGYKAGSA